MKILVSSCDHYADLWPAFFNLLFKYWPECPLPVYLIANCKSYQDPRVVTLSSPIEKGWAGNLRDSLSQIDVDHVVYLQDDYLFHAPVHSDVIMELCNLLGRKQGAMLQLKPRAQDSNEEQTDSPAEVAHFASSCKWMTTLQAALWNRKYLHDTLNPHWNPWQAESGINLHAKQVGTGFYGIRKGQEEVFPYTEAVKGGYWMPDGVSLCRREDIPLDLKFRPCLPTGRGWIQKIYRSIVKRKTEFSRKLHPGNQSLVVRPLHLG
jgi:hypothetical protein